MKNAKKGVAKRASTRKPPTSRAISEDELKQVAGGGAKATSRLMKACATGEHLKKAIITV